VGEFEKMKRFFFFFTFCEGETILVAQKRLRRPLFPPFGPPKWIFNDRPAAAFAAI
jgi:hypothetical protein